MDEQIIKSIRRHWEKLRREGNMQSARGQFNWQDAKSIFITLVMVTISAALIEVSVHLPELAHNLTKAGTETFVEVVAIDTIVAVFKYIQKRWFQGANQ
jgi:hypothetical protein